MGFSSSALLDHWPYQGAEVKWFRFLPRNWPGNNVVGDAKYEIIAVVEKSKTFSIGIKARCAPSQPPPPPSAFSSALLQSCNQSRPAPFVLTTLTILARQKRPQARYGTFCRNAFEREGSDPGLNTAAQLRLLDRRCRKMAQDPFLPRSPTMITFTAIRRSTVTFIL